MPHYIVTYGPAGSGKGYIKPHYLKHIEEEHKEQILAANTFIAEIDNYVESDPEYKQKVFDILCNFFDKCAKNATLEGTSIGDYLNDLLKDFTTRADCTAWDLSDRLTKVYIDTRRKKNAQLDADIENAVKKGFHIIFETTGQNPNPISWLWHCSDKWNGPLCEKKDYTVSIVYPYVHSRTVLDRARKRFVSRVKGWYGCIKQCKQFLSNSDVSFMGFNKCIMEAKESGVPRLPNIAELESLIPKAQQNLVPYIAAGQVGNIYIYDNDASSKQVMGINIKNGNVSALQQFLKKENLTMDKELLDALCKINE